MAGIRTDRILKITAFTHFAVLISLLIVTAIFTAILIYLRFDSDALKIFGIFFIFYAIPAFYLHYRYWTKNKGEVYEVWETKLIRRKGGEETIYKNDQIEKIIFYLSPALYKDSNFHLLAIESYNYAIVKLKSGENLILTCLLAPRIDKSLKRIQGVSFEKRKRLFCLI